MQSKIAKKLKFSSSVTILYGVTLLLLWQSLVPVISPNNSKVQAQASIITYVQPPKPVVINILSGIPVHINIPELRINKPVLPGAYDSTTNSWVVSDSGVHFAEPSSPANDHAGNTLIYGHNNKWTFGPLMHLTPGDIVEVTTDNNLKFTYVYKNVINFEPTDTSIFDYKGLPKLSLQTCTGWLNQIRSLYQFDFVKVEKI